MRSFRVVVSRQPGVVELAVDDFRLADGQVRSFVVSKPNTSITRPGMAVLADLFCAALERLQLHVYTDVDGCDTVVAFDADDARAVWFQTTGEKPEGYPDRLCFVQRPDEEELAIGDADEPDKPKVTKACGQWAAENGRGFLASTEH